MRSSRPKSLSKASGAGPDSSQQESSEAPIATTIATNARAKTRSRVGQSDPPVLQPLLLPWRELQCNSMGETPMIAQVDPSSLAPLLAGPASAVVVLVLVLWGLYNLVIKHFLPLAAKAVDRHLGQIDKLIETQRDESKGILKALTAIDKRLARLEGGTDVGQLTVTQIHPNQGALSPDRGV